MGDCSGRSPEGTGERVTGYDLSNGATPTIRVVPGEELYNL